MIRSLYRHLLLPAFDAGIKRRKTFRYWRELEQSQWMDEHSLRELQFSRLRDMLIHAEANCDYYRRTWQLLGLRAASLDSIDTFRQWPTVDRETIRQHRTAMRSATATDLISKSTGGSSGVPLAFDLDANSNDRRTAAWHRGYAWAGAAPGTKQFYLWGTALQPRNRMQRLKESLWNRLHRKTLFNSFELSESNALDLTSRIERCRPDAIVAYVKPLYQLVRCLDEQGIRPYSPSSIVVGAEKLHDFERERIERVLRAPVYETYGSREFMLIAAECEQHRGLHLTAEHLLVELLDDDGAPVPAGTEGNVVITDLFNYGMPFIRYQTGDRAVATDRPCACGRGLPMLHHVAGRQLDVIHTPDGRLIPGEFFPHLMKDFSCVRQFQVVQSAMSELLIRIVAVGEFAPAFETIVRITQQHAGPTMNVSIERVDSIPLTAAGKRRVVVSQIHLPRAA